MSGERLENQRKAPRVPFTGPVALRYAYAQLLGEASDISTSGMTVTTPVEIVEAPRIGLAFSLPGVGSLELEGLVIQQRKQGTDVRAGIAFIEVPLGAGQMIEDYVFDQLIIPG